VRMWRFSSQNGATATREVLTKRRGEGRRTFWPSARFPGDEKGPDPEPHGDDSAKKRYANERKIEPFRATRRGPPLHRLSLSA